jgi:hypothetical protein
MVLNLSQLIKSCGTETHPAAETESIGLSADAQLSWFLQSHLYSFTVTRDLEPSTGIRPSTVIIPSGVFTVTQNSEPSTGIIPSRLFIVTNELSAIYRDFYLDQKLSAVYRDFAKTHANACRGRQLN